MIVRGSGAMERAQDRSYDVCIVGAGPAGIILAAELANRGMRMCVIESGGNDRDEFADSLREVVSEGLSIRENSRERVVGGATATWAGLSALLDPIDYEARTVGDTEGWPVDSKQLASYICTASEKYGFPPLSLLESRKTNIVGWESLTEKRFAAPVEPLRFGRRFMYLFERSHIDLYTHTTVLRLTARAEGGTEHTESAECASDQYLFKIKADRFILATGGIENPRILLSSKTQTGTLGNTFDQVGRYFMNHPKANVGSIAIKNKDAAAHLFQHGEGDHFWAYSGLRISESIQRENNLLNAYIRLEPMFPWSDSETWVLIRSIGRTIKDSLRAIFHRQVLQAAKGLSETLHLVVSLLPRLPDATFLATQRVFFIFNPIPSKASVRCFIDMPPRREHRVVLSGKKNTVGADIPLVRHSLSREEFGTVQALLDYFSEEVRRLNIGIFTPAKNIETLPWSDASHHLGATRMGRDPRTSVVDENLRVHGTTNLYVAGSSVFPTGGCANPTLVIAALSVRLAEHLIGGRYQRTHDSAVGAWKVLIFGSGRRVSEDVIPALEKLEDQYTIKSIFARRPSVVVGHLRHHQVREVSSLTNEDVQDAKLIYIAVPPKERKKVLLALSKFDTSHAILVLDTPAQKVRGLNRFASVHVAEDMTELPWLQLFKNRTVTEIVCDRSVYEYHGVALIRALYRLISNKRSWVFGYRRGNIYTILVGDLRARITEPRDYAHGSLRIKSIGTEADAVICSIQSGFCSGFMYENAISTLTQVESELAGEFHSSDTVVTKMLALKRVGLYRMLERLRRGEQVWGYSDGRRDAILWNALKRIRFWIQKNG